MLAFLPINCQDCGKTVLGAHPNGTIGNEATIWGEVIICHPCAEKKTEEFHDYFHGKGAYKRGEASNA